MGTFIARARTPWEDRFRTPTDKGLLAGMSPAHSELVMAARETLAGLEGAEESLEWNGLPWRWSWVYRVEESLLPVAYLIPDPQRPQIASTVNATMLETIGLSRLKRYTREGLAHARHVAGVYWPVWEVTQRWQLDEVLDVVGRKHRVLTGADEAVANGAPG